MSPYQDFINRLKLLIKKNPQLITTTLSNIFTCRLIGNKTHGDLSEIAIAEFINQFMYDYQAIHVGKDLFRAKDKEQDIKIKNEITGNEFPVSLKAYGLGPLQLSTDKNNTMFPALQPLKNKTTDKKTIDNLWQLPAFKNFDDIHILPLIYDEKEYKCNILIFNTYKAKNNTKSVTLLTKGHGRKHPVYIFLDKDKNYICEVRYGDKSANALQRGLWTNTEKAIEYFDSLTDGWISYQQNKILVQFFSYALIATTEGIELATEKLKNDIDEQKNNLNK
ncbi:MAG: hypothetical protein ACR2NY_03680 [Alphaproteobacteria bacterium]